MSSSLADKLIVMRESERLNRRELSDLLDIPYGSLTYYETGRSTPPTDVAMKILAHPKFTKYTMWFMTDQIAPEAGQIAPVLAHFGQGETTSSHSDKKTG
ncbi:helix-turn-helix domain-containing protein [Rahnella sp. PD12R]|uniref:helix-turn-helix domain-containing protein n=1 Tax=Rahnella TaxID=34037 RepID=UPI001C272F86|nr:helix-turn-helix transcriptional regulator [Rahnella sp. PD12R]MBU9852455.1 helix-turn-helix transcriptional regulator [Rahnella aceris]MBV6820951.1 helix-turn-helix domain-containing protein [Rahnella sp. PD12R]